MFFKRVFSGEGAIENFRVITITRQLQALQVLVRGEGDLR